MLGQRTISNPTQHQNSYFFYKVTDIPVCTLTKISLRESPPFVLRYKTESHSHDVHAGHISKQTPSPSAGYSSSSCKSSFSLYVSNSLSLFLCLCLSLPVCLSVCLSLSLSASVSLNQELDLKLV